MPGAPRAPQSQPAPRTPSAPRSAVLSARLLYRCEHHAPSATTHAPLALDTGEHLAPNPIPRESFECQPPGLCRLVSCRVRLCAAVYPRFCTAIPPIYTELTPRPRHLPLDASELLPLSATFSRSKKSTRRPEAAGTPGSWFS